MKVRFAAEQDAEEILELLKVMHAENGLAEFDLQKVWNCIHHLIRDGYVLVVEIENSIVGSIIVGSIGFTVEELWYSSQQYLRDWWWFVHPEHRRTNAAARLKLAADKLAEELGLTYQVVLMSPVRMAAKMRLFRQLGLRMMGAVFLNQRSAADVSGRRRRRGRNERG